MSFCDVSGKPVSSNVKYPPWNWHVRPWNQWLEDEVPLGKPAILVYPLHVIQRLKQNSDGKIHLQCTLGLPSGVFYVLLSRCVAKFRAQPQIPSSMIHFSRKSILIFVGWVLQVDTPIQHRNTSPTSTSGKKLLFFFVLLRRRAPKQIFRLVAETQLREMQP